MDGAADVFGTIATAESGRGQWLEKVDVPSPRIGIFPQPPHPNSRAHERVNRPVSRSPPGPRNPPARRNSRVNLIDKPTIATDTYIDRIFRIPAPPTTTAWKGS